MIKMTGSWELIESLPSQLINQIVLIELVIYFIGFNLSLDIAFPELKNDITDFALILFLVIFDPLKEEQVYHHGLCTAGKKDILSISFQFFLRSSLKACPSGCLNLVVGFVDCFTVDDPVDGIDQFLYIEGGGVSFLQIFVIVVFVLLAESVYVCPYNIFQFCVLGFVSYGHFVVIDLQFFVPAYFLQENLFFRNGEIVELGFIEFCVAAFFQIAEDDFIVWLLGLFHRVDHFYGFVDIRKIAFCGYFIATFVEFQIQILRVKIVSQVEDAKLALLVFDCHAIASDEERAKQHLRKNELFLMGEFVVVGVTNSVEDISGALFLFLHYLL